MERLTFEAGKYVAIEAAVHMARYSVARRLTGGKRILDIACGEGYGSYLMATRWGGKHVTAVDISQEAVDAARRNFSADNITYEVGEADTLSKRYPPGSFDLVVSLETIEHLADPEKFLAEIKAVCTQNATVIISCPNDPVHYKDHTAHNPFHLKTYTAAEFFSMAEASLGPCKQKFAGTPVLGFGNFAYDGSLLRVGESMKSMLNFVETDSPPLLVPPDDAIDLDDASYYIGVWSFGDYVPFDATISVYPSALNSAAQAELSAEVTKLRTDIWDLTHASPRTDERSADQQHVLKEQALRLSVLGAENKLAREGVAELRQQLSQKEADLSDLRRLLSERAAELSEARAAIASVPWKAVGAYRRVRKLIPEPAMRVIRKAMYRSR